MVELEHVHKVAASGRRCGINRLIEPTSGTITVAATDIAAQKPHELRLHIGCVIQQVGLFEAPRQLCPSPNECSVVASGPAGSGKPTLTRRFRWSPRSESN